MEYHQRLALDVYRFSFSKFYRRLKKRYGDVDKLAEYLEHNEIFSLADDPLVDGIFNILYNLTKVGEIFGGLKEDGRASAEVVENPTFLEQMDSLWAYHCKLPKSEESLSRLEGWAISAQGMFPCSTVFDRLYNLTF